MNAVEADLQLLADRLGPPELPVIPLAAKLGDNVVNASENTPWYDGPTLLEYFEGIELSAPQLEPSNLRLAVQWGLGPPRMNAAATPAGRRRVLCAPTIPSSRYPRHHLDRHQPRHP